MKQSRIVAVTGGRDYRDRATLYRVLDAEAATDGIAVLVHGGCPSGADALADAWAEERKVSRRIFRADWSKHGPAAGPIRNGEMLRATNPHVLIAFPGGVGTADCVCRAEGMGIPVVRLTEGRA